MMLSQQKCYISMRMPNLRYQRQQHPSHSSQNKFETPPIRCLLPLPQMTPIYIPVAACIFQSAIPLPILFLHRMYSDIPISTVSSQRLTIQGTEKLTEKSHH